MTMSKIIKRDGRIVEFDPERIARAILKAGEATGTIGLERAWELTKKVIEILERGSYPYTGSDIPSVEEIQEVVEHVLMANKCWEAAKAYIRYRHERTKVREGKTRLIAEMQAIIKETHRENANIGNSPSAKMLQIASAASKKYYLEYLLPYEFSEAHRSGDIHIHDLDFFGLTLTCVQIPLGRLLEQGFDNGHGYIRPPKRIGSATALAAIILQSCQNDMHGGQSFAFFDRDLAPYAAAADENETYQAMEALVFNLNSMHSRAGAQVPFSSINLGCDTSVGGRRVTRNLLLAYESGLGKGENPIFPNIIFRVKEGINFHPTDPNYDLFQLACRVASKRLNPTFCFMDASFNKPYGTEVATMGCRTRVIANRHGPSVTNGRGNLSFTSINLPRCAILDRITPGTFWKNLDGAMDIAIRQLHFRYKVQANLRVKDMPFLMGQKIYMNSENLDWEDRIEPAIKHGTLSVGFIGLAETLLLLTGKHHGESKEAQELGLQIVQRMRKRVDEACEEYDLNYTLLATPAEGLSGRFVKLDRERFGIILGVTDKEFYTNSYHIPVDFPITAYDKLRLEGPYHKYCNAGHISYVELQSPPAHNLEAVEALIRHMAACDMGYGGINYPIDFCKTCSYQGVFPGDCPRCGSGEISRVRRITGYLSTVDKFNDAKKAELKARRAHINR